MTTFAEDLVAAFEPWLTDDLTTYLEGLAVPFAQLEELAFDVDDADPAYDGWTLLLDPTRAPAYALPWLAQFLGERLPAGLETSDEDAARQWLIDHPNARRGTIESIVRVAQRTLTGSKFVAIYERTPTNEDYVTVNTMTSETPNSALVAAELRRDAVPADIVLVYATVTGLTYTALTAHPSAPTYTAMAAHWPDYNAVAADSPTGGVHY